jgi:hypothetical protein
MALHQQMLQRFGLLAQGAPLRRPEGASEVSLSGRELPSSATLPGQTFPMSGSTDLLAAYFGLFELSGRRALWTNAPARDNSAICFHRRFP